MLWFQLCQYFQRAISKVIWMILRVTVPGSRSVSYVYMMRKRHLGHMTIACLQILSQCRPTAIGSATFDRSNNSLGTTSNWRQIFTTECKRSKSTRDVPAIRLPGQDPWCPSSKELEATWLSLKCNYTLWYKIRWQRFSFLTGNHFEISIWQM